MNDERLKKYQPLFISIFMLVSFLGLGLFGSFLWLTMLSGMEDFYDYYKLYEWGFTVSRLKLFGYITLFLGWSAWFGLAFLIESKLKIQIFRRSFYGLNRVRIRPNLLKVISRKQASSTEVANKIKGEK